MNEWMAAIDWVAVVAHGAWFALIWVTLRMAWLGWVALWHAARAILRAFRWVLRVTLAKRGVRA